MPHPDAKTALALALRDALTTTPLSKVTVSGLTRTAGVTRQAFYYHFSDIRDLTGWDCIHTSIASSPSDQSS